MDKAIIIGAGTYGQVYAEYLKDTKQYDIIAFLDDDKSKHQLKINDIPVIGSVSKLHDFDNRAEIAVFVPIGVNSTRIRILNFARKLLFKTPGFIHPTAQIHSTVRIGVSVYILPGTQIMPHTIIEDNVMISMGVNIAHHTRLGNGCFLSQGVNVGASIEIGVNAFLGIASTIMTGIKSVGKGTTIGAGAVIIRDVPDYAVVVGNPGKIIKTNQSD